MAAVAAAPKKVGRDLTQGPIFQSLLLFAMPMVLTNLIQQVYSMVDLMVIGQFVGSTGTTGVSVGGEIIDLLTPIATAFSMAGQVYIGQLAGAKREREQREAIGTFLTLNILLAVAFMFVTIVFCTPLLRLLNCPEEAMDEAEAYMIITAMGLPFIFGYNAVCGVLRGMGESKRPLIFILVAAVANIFLDVLLVAVFDLSAAGTAIATAVSQFASFGASGIFMYKRRDAVGFSLRLSYFKMKWEHTKVILKLGLPQAARSMLVRVSMFWVNANVNSFGLVASSTNGVGNKLQKFLEIFSTSFSHASSAMVAQNLGAKKLDRARSTVHYAFLSSLVCAAIISVMVALFPRQLFGIFSRDPGVLELGVTYLHIMIVHFFASALTSSYQSMIIGAGNASLNFVLGTLDGVVCKIGFSLIFEYVFHMGVLGFFWGTAVSRIIPGIITLIYFYGGYWKKATLLKAGSKA